MRIALVSPYDYPYPGGVTEHITALDRYLRACGHDTRIIAPSSTQDGNLGDHIIKVSGAIASLPVNASIARVSLSPHVFRRTKKILRQEKFDLIHIHEPTVPMLAIAVLRYSHAINVGTFHAYRDSNPAYAYMRPLFHRVFGRLHGRIFVSDAVRDSITRYFPGDYALIPNGIDHARFASSGIQPIERFDDGRPNILFVGRMDQRKGFHHLMRAFPYVKERFPSVRLLVVGAFDDPEVAPFVRQARARRLRGIHFIGRVSPELLPRYYRAATIFCAPSTGLESFGIVLLEAMAAGVPIVASDIKGYRSVLEHEREGLLVPAGNADEIARAIVALLGAPSRRAQMSEQGKSTAAQYDWNIIARRVLDYYEQLVASRVTVRTRERSVRDRHLLHWGRLRRSLRAMRP